MFSADALVALITCQIQHTRMQDKKPKLVD